MKPEGEVAGEQLSSCERKLLDWVRRCGRQVGGFGAVTATIVVEYHNHKPASVRIGRQVEIEERFR